MTPSTTRVGPLVSAFVMFVTAAGSAQVGVTTDILTGIVVSTDGTPLQGVLVEATSLESEITRTARTNRSGRYTILFPDGGGQYQMVARMVGTTPRQTTLVRYADEDRLVWDVVMEEQPFVLDEIEVRANIPRVVVPNRPTPGSTVRNLTPDQIANLPIDPEDLNVLAALVPGIVPIDGTDSTGAAFSVAGQRPDANAITLDGMRAESGQVPQEGIRNTRVISSTFDVSRGGFSGGQIAATTRSGANQVQGTFNYSLRSDRLSFETGDSPFSSAFTQNQFGAGLGGPIVRNRLFAYVSGQARLRRDPLIALTSASLADLARLGVSSDSVARFMEIVDGLGVSPSLGLDDSRDNDRLTTMLRVDYLVSGSHTLTLRGDWRGTLQEPSRVSALALPETGGDNESSGGGFMASLASRFGAQVINEARVMISTSDRSSNPYLSAPQGRVQVASQLDDGTMGISTLILGGNPRMPISATTSSFELSNELSWLPGAATHRFKLGGQLSIDRSTNLVATNQLGTFTFNSLQQLESGLPASFRRTLTPNERGSDAIEWGIYGGDVWRASRALQLTYGIRVEGSTFRNPPAYNPDLDASLGIRTDRLPSEVDVSPRAGFTWSLGTGGGFGSPPSLIVRGGAGRFRSPIPNTLVAQTQTATGLATSEQDLNCIGGAVPIPDWTAYRQDPDAIPTACNGAGGPAVSRASSATIFADGFGAPKSWRASLSAQRNLTTLLRLSLGANYARGVSQYGFRDRNLDTTPGFTLSNEDDRPVFVDPARVVPISGAVRLNDSRIDPQFAQVLEIGSDLESETKQVTVSLGGVTRSGVLLNTSYTWSHVRDQSSQSVRFGSGSLAGTTTGGNPNAREWSRSSFERRHAFLATVSYPFGTTLEVTAIGRLTSGTPYTPLVATDINGDGARNDRAFVFAPGGATPVSVSNGMEQLLANTSPSARRCLERSFGRVAERNSCVGPWQSTLDLQMNYRPTFLGLNGNLSISVITVNLLRGLDELLHGADGAKGWGLRTRPDPTLLFVEGFDPTNNTFSYSVNERFGASGARNDAFRNPFQLGIQMRWGFGPNRQRAALDRIRGGRGAGAGGFAGAGRMAGRGGAGPGGRGGGRGGIREALGSPDEFVARFESNFTNPAHVILGLRDTLTLTDEQIAAITTIGDSLTTTMAALAGSLRLQFEEADATDLRALIAVLQPTMQEGRERVGESLGAIRAILTEDQWGKLPPALRNSRGGRRR